jgi:hypothetical protein
MSHLRRIATTIAICTSLAIASTIVWYAQHQADLRTEAGFVSSTHDRHATPAPAAAPSSATRAVDNSSDRAPVPASTPTFLPTSKSAMPPDFMPGPSRMAPPLPVIPLPRIDLTTDYYLPTSKSAPPVRIRAREHTGSATAAPAAP